MSQDTESNGLILEDLKEFLYYPLERDTLLGILAEVERREAVFRRYRQRMDPGLLLLKKMYASKIAELEYKMERVKYRLQALEPATTKLLTERYIQRLPLDKIADRNAYSERSINRRLRQAEEDFLRGC